MTVTHKLKIDFAQIGNPPHISMMQNDSARTLELSLYANNVSWSVPSGSSAYLAFTNSNGENIKCLSSENGEPVVTYEKNVATINVPSILTADSGDFPAVVVFVDNSAKQIATFPFAVSVYKNPATDGEESDSVAPDQFTQLLSAITLNKARIDNLSTIPEGSTTGNAELLDIRVGYDGTTYANAGEAVREQTKKVNDGLSNVQNRLTRIDGIHIENDTEEETTPEFESGKITIADNALVYSGGSNFIRTKQDTFVHLNEGDTLGLPDYTQYTYSVFYKDNGVWTNKTYYGVKGDFVVTVPGDYAIVIQSADASSLVDKVDEVAALLFINRAEPDTDTDEMCLIEEVEDIRTGYDGAVYETAGEAVRVQMKKMADGLTALQEQINSGATGGGGNDDSGGNNTSEIPAFESGKITIADNALVYSGGSNFIRTPENVFVHLNEGDVVGLPDYTQYTYSMYYMVDSVWTNKTYYGVGGDFVAPVDGDYAIVIQSQDASSLVDKVDEVASNLFITRAGAPDSGGSDSGENNGTDAVVPSGDTFTFVNLVDNSKDSNFSGQSGALTHEDGWHKMSPNGSSAYPRINCAISKQLEAGHKYLVAYTMQYDLGNITANGAFPRLVAGGTTLTGNFDLKWLTGKRYFAVNRCACIFECETTLRYTLEMMVGYATASDAAGTWYAVRDINVIDITDMEEIPEPYHLGNMILAQSNSLVTDTQTVDMDKETLFPLQNHTILFMGDSIFGNYNVPKYVSDISKAKTINGAIGGTTATWYNPSLTLTESLVSLSESIKTGDWSAQAASTKESVNRLKALDFNTVNDLVIEIGTNDWRRNADIGEDDSTDIATFKGALNTIISNILSAYPEIDIYMLTPLFRTEFGNSNTTPNDSGVYLYDFADAMIDIARKYGIPVYDMYHHGGINEYNHTKYLSDGTHPLPIMRMKIAKIINDLIVY